MNVPRESLVKAAAISKKEEAEGLKAEAVNRLPMV